MAIPNDTCGDSPPRDQSRATLSCSDTLLAVEISSVKNAVWRGGVALAHIVTGMYVLVRGDIIYMMYAYRRLLRVDAILLLLFFSMSGCSTHFKRCYSINLFRTAVPFWGQFTQIIGNLSPKRGCGPKKG